MGNIVVQLTSGYLLFPLFLVCLSCVRFCVYAMRNKYHPAVVTKDLWRLYKGRQLQRDFHFVKQSPYYTYGMSVERGIDYESRCAVHDLVPQLQPVNDLVTNEIYLRVAHRANWGMGLQLGHCYIDRSVCRWCTRVLPVAAFFIGNCYHCVQCIGTEILPRFCGPRLYLLRASGLIPDELCLFVAKQMGLLCFSADDSTTTVLTHCDCQMYDCKSDVEKRQLLLYMMKFRVLRKRLSGFVEEQ